MLHRTTRRRPSWISTPPSPLGLVPALLALALFALASLAPSPAGAAAAKRTGRRSTIDRISAQVDSISILRSEVEDQTRFLAAQANVNLKDPAAARKLKNDVLDRMVEEKVIASEARRENIQVTQPEIDQEVEQALGNARQSLGSEQAFQEQLKRENLTEDKLRQKYAADFRAQLMARKLVQREVQGKVSVDSSDARTYYETHKNELRPRPQTYRLSAILIRIKPSDAVKAKAHEKAAGVLARVKAGEDFGKLATMFSDDPSAREEGQLPWFGRGDLDSTFTTAAFALKPGQTSDLVETRFGFHIIRVDSVQGERVKARHILVLLQPSAADSAAALQRATAVHSRAVAHEDFAKLAEQFSDDPDSRARGGELEPNDSTSLNRVFPPEVVQSILAMQPSQISSVLPTGSGYVILRLDGREAPRPYRFAEISRDLEDLARQEKLKSEYDRWVAGLKKKHRVTVRHF